MTVCTLLSGCISDKYDLSKEMSLGLSFAEEGFQIAGASDVDIPMSQIIELKDSSELMIDSLTGNYLFYKYKDDMDTVKVCQGHGSICNGTDDLFDCPIMNNPAVVITPSKRYQGFGSLQFETVMTPSYQSDYIKNSICEFHYLKVNLDIEVSMNFSNLDGVTYFDELQYEVPFFYVVENKNDLVEKNVRTNGVHTHRIHVIGVNFLQQSPYEGEQVGIDPVTRQLILKGSVRMKGVAKTVNINSLEQASDPTINFRVQVGTLGTLAVTGRFFIKENVHIDPIEFNNLPDFIRDEEVTMDVENPQMRLTLMNEVPATISLNADLNGYRDNQQISSVGIGEDYDTAPIAFDGPVYGQENERTSTLWISRKAVADMPAYVTENVVIPEIIDVVSKIPDEIWLTAYARTDSNQVTTLSLSEEYKAVPKYEMYVPLKIGKDMKIVYSKEFENLNEAMKMVDLNELVLTAQARNRLPLDLSMKIQAFDTEGQEVTGFEYVLPSQEHPISGSNNETLLTAESVSNITIRMKNVGTENNFHKVDRLKLKIYALSSEKLEGQYLNRNQNLQLNDVKIVLK